MGLTAEQIINLKNLTDDLWALLNQDDYNKIVEIYKNAIDREGHSIFLSTFGL